MTARFCVIIDSNFKYFNICPVSRLVSGVCIAVAITQQNIVIYGVNANERCDLWIIPVKYHGIFDDFRVN